MTWAAWFVIGYLAVSAWASACILVWQDTALSRHRPFAWLLLLGFIASWAVPLILIHQLFHPTRSRK